MFGGSGAGADGVHRCGGDPHHGDRRRGVAQQDRCGEEGAEQAQKDQGGGVAVVVARGSLLEQFLDVLGDPVVEYVAVAGEEVVRAGGHGTTVANRSGACRSRQPTKRGGVIPTPPSWVDRVPGRTGQLLR